MKLNIAIAGGGIAGLTAALAFAKNGHQVTVFEQANSLRDIGAGIQISPNANKVLAKLGLAADVKAISFEPEVLNLVNGKTGRTLSALPFETMMRQRYGAPYLVVHRGDLQTVLLIAANADALIKVQTGMLIDRFNDVGDGIEIAGKKFDLLIVADGINSTLRKQIDPKASIISDGQTAWRATLPVEEMSQKAVRVFMNAGAHLVAYKMGAHPHLNLVYVTANGQKPSAIEFDEAASRLINAARDWKAWPLAAVQSNIWHKGRAVMIGDAAHAMTPHAAQGGAMAIEDAMILADCVEAEPTIKSAFARYQTIRQPRIARVKALSSQNRAIYQMGGVTALGRNLVTPFIPPSVLLKRLDWLYGWKA